MSTTFYIRSGKRIDKNALAKELSTPNAQVCVTQIDEVTHFFVPDVTCRSIEFSYERGSHNVRIAACSDYEDWELASSLIELVAKVAKSPILTEENQIVPASDFRRTYGAAAIDALIIDEFRLMITHAKETSGSVGLEGAVREFHVGPRMAKELLAIKGEPQRVRVFFEKFRRSQWFDQEEYFVPKVMVMKDTKHKVVAWGPNVAYYFPWINYFALVDEEKETPMFVPHKHLADLAENITWLDEKQTLVAPTSSASWSMLLHRAKMFAVPQSVVCGE